MRKFRVGNLIENSPIVKFYLEITRFEPMYDDFLAFYNENEEIVCILQKRNIVSIDGYNEISDLDDMNISEGEE